jgi:alginate O-acetyltransferase complex protein AlgI
VLTFSEIFKYNEHNPLIFSQYLFLFWLTIIFGIFVLFFKNKQVRKISLLAFSLFFYYKSGGLYFWILIFSTLVDFYLGNAIYAATNAIRKKWLLVASLVANLGMLAFFKYSKFIVDLVNANFGTHFEVVNYLAGLGNLFGGQHDLHTILLPVGISFFTFQTLSYSIDIYRGELKPAKNLVDFAFFVTFFPQLVAGPIVRAADFLPQINKKFHITKEQLGAAIFLILCGLFKKVVVSDYISVNFVERVFKEPMKYNGFENLMAMYGYSMQIYCDFSGYSDMAIGLAALFGFRLPINFNSPYKATSITDFWRRWHISLSTWLRDYLYISLGGNRKGKIRTYINLIITMLLGGLWHGAAFKFIIWGGLHGLGLAVHKAWMKYVPSISKINTKWSVLITGLITFHFVVFCWVYFRAANLQIVGEMLGQVFSADQWYAIGDRVVGYAKVFSIIALGFFIHFLPTRWKDQSRLTFTNWHHAVQVAVVVAVIFISFQVKSADIVPFIYFDF